MSTRAWERIGFARLGDYARERAGLSAREVQDLAYVDGRLRALPQLEAALVAGALGWTQVRLLARIANADDEAHWLAYARTVSARALAREVRAVDAGSLEAGVLTTDEDGVEEDENGSVIVRCSSAVQGLFHRARWLARRVAGEDLASWACMEAVAAEVLSAVPLDSGPDSGPEEGSHRLCTEAGCRWERPASAAALVAEAARSACAAEPDATGSRRARDGATLGTAVCGFAELSTERAAVPASTHDALLAGLAEADAFELDARLRRAVVLEQHRDAELAPLVLAVAERGLHRLRGFATLEAWARERLGISPRKVRALRRLARAGLSRPVLGEAFRSGRLSWVQAHTLLPVLALPEADVSAWVERAASISVRRLRDEVDRALLGGGFVEPRAEQEPERQTGAQDTLGQGEPEAERFFFIGPRDVTELFHAVLCSVRRLLERASGRLPTEGDAAGWMFAYAIGAWVGNDRRVERAHRVFARDGWRCTVPGCTSYRNLHDHHVEFRSAGGSDELTNRTTLCAFHHLRGVHAGRVRVIGVAPNDLRFELGLRTGREPLLAYDAREQILR